MDTPEILATLRNEIIEPQKTQAEFLKWKLIAVSADQLISGASRNSSIRPAVSSG